MRNLIIVLAIISALSTKAQDNSSRFYRAIGFTLLADYTSSIPLETTIQQNIYNPILDDFVKRETTVYGQTYSISVFTFIYRFRYNILELDDDHVISISSTPAIALSPVAFEFYNPNSGTITNSEMSGVGTLTIPFMLGYEQGLSATRNSELDYGLFIKLGYEFIRSPIIFSDIADDDVKNLFWSVWGQGVLATGFRYKTKKKNKVQEINFKINYRLGHRDVANIPSESPFNVPGMRLSFIYPL